MASVHILRTSAVTVPASSAPLPLSAFDAAFVPIVPLRHIYLFPSPTPATVFPMLVERAKRSLAQILPSFLPFAGELTYLSSRTLAIAFPEDGAHVTFVEAETDIDFNRLLEAVELDSEALGQLVPDIQPDVLPAPVMAVQVTQAVGGVALGVALHHTVVDGRGLFHFMDTWTAAAAGSYGSSNLQTPLLPLHDRNLIRFDGDEEFNRAVLGRFAPMLPRIVLPNFHSEPEQQPVVRQTFVFTAAALKHLKRQHVAAPENAGEQLVPPSTFGAIAAHGWVSFCHASGFGTGDNGPVFVGFFADCRRSFPSLPEDHVYIGNCIVFCTASLKASELAAPDGFFRALSAIKEAVRKVKTDPLKNKEVCIVHHQWDRTFIVSGSPWFPAYEFDLGFGKPARVERACLGGESEAYLTAGKEPGSVQAMVAMSAEKMPAFRQAFMVDGVHARP